MRIFISWSGSESKRVAAMLRDWIPVLLQAAEPWMSSEDIAKGARWPSDLTEALANSKFAILCITPNNALEPWINFEAGAISNSFKAGHVSPLLIGIEPTALPGTLSQFQCTKNEKEDIKRLIESINACLDSPLKQDRLERGFDAAWPNLELHLAETVRLLSPVTSEPQLAAPNESSTGDLDEPQRAILVLLAENPHDRIRAEDVSRAIGQNLTRSNYHLDKLDKRGLIHRILNMVEPARFVLSELGRAYVVENDLV